MTDCFVEFLFALNIPRKYRENQQCVRNVTAFTQSISEKQFLILFSLPWGQEPKLKLCIRHPYWYWYNGI